MHLSLTHAPSLRALGLVFFVSCAAELPRGLGANKTDLRSHCIIVLRRNRRRCCVAAVPTAVKAELPVRARWPAQALEAVPVHMSGRHASPRDTQPQELGRASLLAAQAAPPREWLQASAQGARRLFEELHQLFARVGGQHVVNPGQRCVLRWRAEVALPAPGC